MSRKVVWSVVAVCGVVSAALAMAAPSGPALGDPLRGLTGGELAVFAAGKARFEQVAVVSDGLGPVYNDVSCAACHRVGGIGGGSTRVESRFGRIVNGVFDPMTYLGGPVVQSRGIGRHDRFNFVGETVPPTATVAANRRTTPLFGLGLVNNVPDGLLIQIATDQMAHTPETAGRPNIVHDVASGQNRVGKFGWKCQEATLLSFSGQAYVDEIGITTPMFPQENCPQGNCGLLLHRALPGVPNAAHDDSLVLFNSFITFLAPPQALPMTPQAVQGANYFAAIGCANCHVPTLATGPNETRALNDVRFSPYSDFLLHDMGSLGDGIPQNGAGTREMRTAPLWGLRRNATFLHDGRTNSIVGAIMAHEGQGEGARDRFATLTAAEQADLVAFLNSL